MLPSAAGSQDAAWTSYTEIGASGFCLAARACIQAPSVQRSGAALATMDAVAGGTSAAQATGSAFCGSGSPWGPSRSYL